MALLTAALLAGGGAAAAVPDRALRAAEEAARAGNHDAAVEQYRALQVDYPDDPRVLFGLGCAHYRKAESLPEGVDPAQRAGIYQEAQAVFDRLLGAADPAVRADAGFNRGNCVAQRAALVPDTSFKEKVQALRQAVAAYEAVLREHPDHAQTRQNLDHVRYRLRSLLQNPPDGEDAEQQPQEEPPPPQQQQVFRFFQQAYTELPGARAVVGEDSDTVELRRQDAAGGTP
jgi:tetratricopeptide (TPR) repeat protein